MVEPWEACEARGFVGANPRARKGLEKKRRAKPWALNRSFQQKNKRRNFIVFPQTHLCAKKKPVLTEARVSRWPTHFPRAGNFRCLK